MRRLLAVLSVLAVLLAGCVRLSPAASAASRPAAPEAGSFRPVGSTRVLDTRTGTGLAAGTTTRFAVAGRGSIPAGSAAVSVNMTVLGATRAGSIAAFAGDTAWNGSASISFVAGQIKQSMISAKLGADGSLAVRNNTAARIQVVGDVVGYYTGGTPTTAGSFAAIPLRRVFDTRAVGAHALAPGSVIRVPLTGKGAIPSGAGAVLTNLTVLGAALAGSVSTWASDATWDGSASESFAAGRPEQDVLAVTVGRDGAAMIRNNAAAPVQVVLDAIGYFLGGTPASYGAYRPTSPTRVFDSRWHNLSDQPVGPGQSVYVNTGKGAVPSVGLPALVARFTVLSPRRAGSISVFPGGAAWNGAASISFGAGVSVQQQLTVVPDASGRAWMLRNNSAVGVSVVVDVLGYYLGVPNPLHFTDNGQLIDPARGRLSGISCPTATFCLAVGNGGYAETWNGTGWSSPAKVGQVAALYSVSCATPTFCLAGALTGQQASVLRFDGTSWQVVLAPYGWVGEPQVSCASTTFCAVTYGDVARTFDGSVWSVEAPVGPQLSALSCPVAGFCMATDGRTRSYRLAGGRWSALPAAGTNLYVLSCLTSTFCLAASGPDVLRYNGTAWSAATGIDPAGDLIGVACASSTACHAMDSNGRVLDYDGTGWSAPATVMADGGGPMSCTPGGRCMAIDRMGKALAVTFDGTGWGRPQPVDFLPGNLDGVSCVSASFCVGVDTGGYVFGYNGTSWAAPQQIADGNRLTSVSCVSTTFCIAVDEAGRALRYDGTSWTAPADVTPGHGLTAVSCASTTFCAAAASDGTVVRYDGTGWTSPVAVLDQTPVAISCPTASFCAVSDDEGDVTTWDGTGWHGPSSAGTFDATGVSCANASYCLLTGTFRSAVFDGTGWTSIDQPSAVDLTAASCPAVGACGVLSYYAAVQYWDGSQLSMSVDGATGYPVGADISCPATDFCMVVTNYDTAYALSGGGGRAGKPAG